MSVRDFFALSFFAIEKDANKKSITGEIENYPPPFALPLKEILVFQ